MPEPLLKKFSNKFVKEGKDGIIKLFDPETSVKSKKSIDRRMKVEALKRCLRAREKPTKE
jgi:hypothetical protein